MDLARRAELRNVQLRVIQIQADSDRFKRWHGVAHHHHLGFAESIAEACSAAARGELVNDLLVVVPVLAVVSREFECQWRQHEVEHIQRFTECVLTEFGDPMQAKIGRVTKYVRFALSDPLVVVLDTASLADLAHLFTAALTDWIPEAMIGEIPPHQWCERDLARSRTALPPGAPPLA